MNHHRSIDTGIQKIEIWRSRAECEFRVAGATHAWWHWTRFLSGLAWDNLAAAAMLRAGGPPQSLLMLGLAGGTSLRIIRHLVPGIRIVAVEIDSAIVTLARHHMDLDSIEAEIHIGDAYEWLLTNRRKFDVVIDDVYGVTPHDVLRPQAPDDRTGNAIDRAVAPGGLFVANLVTGRGHRRMQSAFRQYFRNRFPIARSVTTPAGANEALAGGDVVLSGGCLNQWESRFADPADQALWRKIRVRRL